MDPIAENLRLEYQQRFDYQAHLTDRRWKANGLYFLIFGFSLNAISPEFKPKFCLYVALFNLSAITCTLAYVVTVRKRILKNMERAAQVAELLDIKAFMHYMGKEHHRLLRFGGNSIWYIALLGVCALFWVGVIVSAGNGTGLL